MIIHHTELQDNHLGHSAISADTVKGMPVVCTAVSCKVPGSNKLSITGSSVAASV